MQNAVAYCRFSSDNQREESIDAQIRAIEDFCSKNDFNLIKVYADEARSATSDNREQFLKMIEDSNFHQFDAVIVHKLDRFSRNKYDSAIYKKKLKDNNVQLISVLERLDGSPESILMESLLEGMAEYFSKNLAREVMKGLKENALNCKHTGGISPTGYDVLPDKTYAINEKEAEIVRKIFSMYLSGNGYALIAQELNRTGQCTKLGRLFTKNSIRDILLNEKYTGVYVYNKRFSKKDNHKYKNDSDIIRIENGMPAIISKEDFEKVQDRINNRRSGPRMNSKRFYLLTGKVECGECGGSYVGAGYTPGRNGKKYPIYSCTHKKAHICNNKNVRQDHLEDYVISKLNDTVFSDAAIEEVTTKILVNIEKRNSEHSEMLKSLKKKRKDAEAKSSTIFDLLFEGGISKEACTKKVNELQLEIKEAEKAIMNLENKDFSWVDENKIREYLKGSKARLNGDDPLEKRKVIEQFVYKIIIYPDRVDTTLKVDLLDSDKVGGDKGVLTICLSTTKEKLSSK